MNAKKFLFAVLILIFFASIIYLIVTNFITYNINHNINGNINKNINISSNESKILYSGSAEFNSIYNTPGILLNQTDNIYNAISNGIKNNSFKPSNNINIPFFPTEKKIRNNRKPIIIIPGLGGTQLQTSNTNWGNMNKCQIPERVDGTIWVALVPPPGGPCQLSLVKNEYDANTKTLNTNKNTNINVFQSKPGDINSCYCLNNSFNCLFGEGNYMKLFIDTLKNVGYSEYKDLYAVGYDFRLQPQGNIFDFNTYTNKENYFGKFYLDLKSVVEQAYNNTNKKVVLVGHSMGCFMISLFINISRYFETNNTITTGWVDKYIDSFISAGGAFDGGPKSLRAVLTGDNPGTPIGTNQDWKSVHRTLTGPIVLIPMLNSSYNNNICVKTKNKKYASNEIINLMIDSQEQDLINCSNVYKNLILTKLLALQDPNIPVVLIYGNDLDTEFGEYELNTDNNGKIIFDTPLSMAICKGDRTVPLSSLEVPLNTKNITIDNENIILPPWKNVKTYTVKGMDGEHLEIIKSNLNVINYIIDLISN
jgi:hypothetical protein